MMSFWDLFRPSTLDTKNKFYDASNPFFKFTFKGIARSRDAISKIFTPSGEARPKF
jgi:hypothetical protein